MQFFFELWLTFWKKASRLYVFSGATPDCWSDLFSFADYRYIKVNNNRGLMMIGEISQN